MLPDRSFVAWGGFFRGGVYSSAQTPVCVLSFMKVACKCNRLIKSIC